MEGWSSGLHWGRWKVGLGELSVGVRPAACGPWPVFRKPEHYQGLPVKAIAGHSGFPGKPPRTAAWLPFGSLSSRPRSPAVRAPGSQDDGLVYCFNICLTQGKLSSGGSLPVTCISVKEISRQIRRLGVHHGMAVFATGGSPWRKRHPRLKGRKPPLCAEVNRRPARSRTTAPCNVAPLQILPCKQPRLFDGGLFIFSFLKLV